MTSYHREKTRNGYRVSFYLYGHKHSLWLGNVSAAQAKVFCMHVDVLKHAAETQTPVPERTQLWASRLAGRIRDNFARWGMVPALRYPVNLRGFLAAYIEDQAHWAKGTVLKAKQVERRLLELIGNRPLQGITEGDAERFCRTIRTQYPTGSHAGKVIAIARQFFTAAVKERMLMVNPFDGVDLSRTIDETRKAYVPRHKIDTLLTGCDPRLAAVIVGARYGGFRVPSENLVLQWQHVDWERGRLVIPRAKTATRIIPLFPELRQAFQSLFDLAPDGSRYVFDFHRASAHRRYRKWMQDWAKTKGIDLWPKLWINCRASCRTDLLETYPEHVVNAWMGHSGKVGSKHYDRVTDDHFERASGGQASVRKSEIQNGRRVHKGT